MELTGSGVLCILKGVFAKKKLTLKNYGDLSSICCVYKEKIVKNDSYRRK